MICGKANNALEIGLSGKKYWSIAEIQFMLNQGADISGHVRTCGAPFNLGGYTDL
jgi:hypothetical protein